MNLEDLAKKTISEVSSEIEELQKQKELLKNQEPLNEEEPELIQSPLKAVEADSDIEEVLEESEPSRNELEEQILHSNLESKENQELSSEVLNTSLMVQGLREDIFLKNLRERILVLFEGLSRIKKEDLEQRLKLTIHFLEFLLANIEDKLKK